jgi:Protein of unknown function (DUF2637)
VTTDTQPRPFVRPPGWPEPPGALDARRTWPQQPALPAAQRPPGEPPSRTAAPAPPPHSDHRVSPSPAPPEQGPRPGGRRQRRAAKRARRAAGQEAAAAAGQEAAADAVVRLSASPRPLIFRVGVPVLAILYAALAAGGAVVSFTTVRDEAIPLFHAEAWIVPLLFDVTIAAFLIGDLLAEYAASLNLMDRGVPWARWVAWLFVAGTVYLNVSAAHGSTFGIVTHAGGPGAFVVVTEWIRTLIWRRARLVRRQIRKRENQINRPELRWVFLFGWRALGLWRRAQEVEMLRAYSPGLEMRRLRLDALTAVPAGASRADRRRAVQLAIAARFAGDELLTDSQVAELRTGMLNELADVVRMPDLESALRAQMESVVREVLARLDRAGGRRPPARRSASGDLPPGPPLYQELAEAYLVRKNFTQVMQLLTGRDDLAGLVSWLAVNVTTSGAKRMMALAGLAAVGWDSTPAPVLNWLSEFVPDDSLLPDRKEVTRMATQIAEASSGGGDTGREVSAA